MDNNPSIIYKGLPEAEPQQNAILTARVSTALNSFINKTGIKNFNISISISTPPRSSTYIESSYPKLTDKTNTPLNEEFSIEERASKYKTSEAKHFFDQLVVPEQVRENILLAVNFTKVKSKVFDEWGLKHIEPHPRKALNLYGAPGTGKTLAAHAIANKIGCPILSASYAQIESMYHGEAAKNLEALFLAAQIQNALLFIDEADSLLSKRHTNVTQGSEQATNSMRSQLLMCLDKFSGVVIFSTNLVENYDKAFETRVHHINFPMPDLACRREIWKRHLLPQMPLATDVSPEELAQVDDVCGRDIQKAVIDAAIRVAMKGKELIVLKDLLDEINRIKASRINNPQ